MRKPLWGLAGVALLVSAGVAGTVVVVSSGGEEEVGPQLQVAVTATVDPSSLTPSPGPSAQPSSKASSSPAATPSPVPADWPTYSDPGGLLTIRYPTSWLEIDGDFYSSDPTAKSGPSLAAEIVKVEVNYYPAAGSTACGGLSVDPATGEGSPTPGATATTLGGVLAWRLVREPGDPAIEGHLTRIEGVSAIYKGNCFIVAAYYTQQKPDVAAFERILSTFKFAT
jgi:hypothetical protein